MFPSEEFFADFGHPVYVENGTMNFYDASVGGGWGETWEPDNSIGIGFNVNLNPGSIGGGSGGSAPDVKEVLTAIANEYEDALKRNLAAFTQGQIGGSQAIDAAWNLLNRMTAAMLQYGAQGLISAAERDKRVDPRYLRWDYVAYYIDPISMKTSGAPAPVEPLPSATVPNLQPSYGGFVPKSNWEIWAIGGLLLLLVWKKAKK